MKSDWKTATIGDCCEIEKKSITPQAGIIYKCYSLPAFDNEKRPEILDGQDIKSNKFVLSENTILFNKLNPKFRRVWNIHELNDGNNICSTEFLPLKVKAGIDQDYLYYFVYSEQFTEKMDGIRTGTSNSQQRIDWKRFLQEEISIPDYLVQKKISTFLKNLDDKISINNQMIENLAKHAQILYERLCEECTTTELTSLAELMDYAGGSQPPASEFIFEEKAGYVRFVQIRDYDTDSHITYIPESSHNRLCDEHDIMIARYGASLGRICFGINGAYNVALAKVFPKQPFYREFLRCYLSSHVFYEGINNKGGRSAQAGFNQSDIKSFELRVPSEEDLRNFEDIVSVMFEQRLSLIRQNRNLIVLRDTLLPKLMSDELNVSDLDI